MRPEEFLQRVDAMRASLALEALERPSGKDTFEYGKAVGVIAGLALSKTILIEMFAEKERRNSNL